MLLGPRFLLARAAQKESQGTLPIAGERFLILCCRSSRITKGRIRFVTTSILPPSLSEDSPARVTSRSIRLKRMGVRTIEPWQRARIVALNPGATNSRAKRWLAERFASTADRLAERNGFQTIIVGAKGDVDDATAVASLMRTPATVLA